MMKMREVQQLHAMAKGIPNVTATIKGFNLVLDGRVYERKEFDNLPHGISRERASTVETPDGMAFQGHCSPFSNLYPLEITDKQGRKTSNNEYTLVITMAELCRADLDLVKQLRETTNPNQKNGDNHRNRNPTYRGGGCVQKRNGDNNLPHAMHFFNQIPRATFFCTRTFYFRFKQQGHRIHRS